MELLLSGLLKPVLGIVTKLLNELQALDGFELDLAIIILKSFEIVDEHSKLLVQQLLQKLNILSFGWVAVKDLLDHGDVMLALRRLHLLWLRSVNFAFAIPLLNWSSGSRLVGKRLGFLDATAGSACSDLLWLLG